MKFKLGLIRQENHKNADEKQSCGGFEASLGSSESRGGRMIVGVGGSLILSCYMLPFDLLLPACLHVTWVGCFVAAFLANRRGRGSAV